MYCSLRYFSSTLLTFLSMSASSEVASFELSLYQKLFVARALPDSPLALSFRLFPSRYNAILDYAGELWNGEKQARQKFMKRNADISSIPPNSEDPCFVDWMSMLPEKNRRPYADPNDPLNCHLQGTYCFDESSMERISVEKQVLERMVPKLEIPVYTVPRDSKGFPMNPQFNKKCKTGVYGRGVLGKWGPNHAGDALVTRRNPVTQKLQILLIKRGDSSGKFAFPGGFANPGEFSIPIVTIIREFLEEVIGTVEHSDLKSLTIHSLKDIFGDFRWIPEEGKLFFTDSTKINWGKPVYAGIVEDERNTENAWIETLALHWHIPEPHASTIKLSAGDDAILNSAHFYDIWGDNVLARYKVEPLTNLFASHSRILRRLLEQSFPDEIISSNQSTLQ
ncbi:nudix -type motif 9 isoform a family protein [Cardiosporidium cionae]|uniref:Nudix -type motif 9 isoform a family protein n=1 Tax=Cardiosporidium cionae TaxID=476202 RepID=A0ABQ7J8H3_9APIC|nr:nudix -type motif 9 isoform a family protein [Cardiosporidium cionae]|eukprot:KAF8820298.1 nudix -type motif 9 isoform a family protein [Cardiosporidium cionae]